jgi:hypothetical protein
VEYLTGDQMHCMRREARPRIVPDRFHPRNQPEVNR